MKTEDFEYSIGNSKIGRDTIIFNLGSATDCPSKKLGLCHICKRGERCYALKPEIQYKDCLPYRRRQEKYWKSHASSTITDDIKKTLKKHKKVKYVRFNESGDLWYGEDIMRLIQIANENKDYVIYGYTSRRDIIDGIKSVGWDKKIPKNLVINLSGFEIDGYNSFGDYPESKYKCGGDCSICNLCKKNKGIKIHNDIH